ncbi:MAG TPA: site-specific integrase [Steroidobacter sp.]|uniref:tyrosine-type recombinase/integrase n=1 Tax=Steroidobacter sp. TaxID=1978227 RepID=UPI002ED998EF
MHLTKKKIDAAKYKGADNARCVLWDDDPRGLGLRVYPSGRKAWLLSYRVAGRKRMMALGDYGVLTLDQARSRAKRELAAIENQSVDPLAEKRKRALEARTGTVEAMFRAFVADKKQKTADELLRQAELHIFPAFGKRGWQEVTRSEVRSWHEGIKAPYAANRALAALRAAYYWRLWREDDSPQTKHRDFRNPCVGVEMRPEKARQVRLERDELPRLQKAIDAEQDPYVRALFRFLLAVGCRRNEALSLHWADVRDSENPSVTFRDTKGGDDRIVPLSPYAADLLASLTRVSGNPFVFAGRVPGKGLTAVAKAWQRIRKAAGVEHVHIHDLRRSFGSWLGDAGFTSKQIGSVLGHKSDITSRVYMALGDESKRAAVNAMEALMTGKKANVVKLRKRAAR